MSGITHRYLNLDGHFAKVFVFNLHYQFTEEAGVGVMGPHGAFVQLAHGLAAVLSSMDGVDPRNALLVRLGLDRAFDH